VLTGEHRPYDKKGGYARRVLPNGRRGALGTIERYGLVDLTGGQTACAGYRFG
jgi:phosphate-selective porin